MGDSAGLVSYAVVVDFAELGILESKIGFRRAVAFVYCNFGKGFVKEEDFGRQTGRCRVSSFDHNASSRHY